ncbi:hypothetical protein J6S88_05280 [bacterium]|nr:hypothetical protein [bacterium]
MPLNIGKIGTFVNNMVCKPLNAIGNMKIMNGLNKGYQSNNAKIIAGVSVASIVLKDGLGCVMYVKQSLNNKKIPEEKRKFVAALDLINGILMVGTQIGMFFLFNKCQDKLFKKYFGKYFSRSARKGYMARLKNIPGMENLAGLDFHKGADKYMGTVASAFKQLTSLIVTSIIAKRIIVPFLSTPLADSAKAWMDKKPVKNDEECKAAA